MANSRRDFLSSISSATALGFLQAQTLSASELPSSLQKPLGVALVGLGNQSIQTLLADLDQSPWCRIAGLVSGDSDRAGAYASKLGLSSKQVYNYESFDKIASDDSIDLVYIALPNALHCEYAVRAAQSGKHVFCESPMAVNSNQCQTMIEACKRNSRALAVASSPLPKPLGCLGRIQSIEASNALSIDRPNSWRWSRELAGGGALLQSGIDVLRTQRIWANSEPVWVIAQETKTDVARFANLDESVTWSIGFANGAVAHGAVSLNYAGQGKLQVTGQTGSFACAFPSTNHYWTRADQLESFAASILKEDVLPANRFNSLGADEALQDMMLVEAILVSINHGRQVQLG